MPTVIPVKFKYSARDLWFDPKDSGAVEADHVICNTARGREIGIATNDAREVSYQELKATCGNAPIKSVERVATEADLAYAEELAERGEAAMPVFRRLANASGLDMKPVGVEWLFESDRVVCYFSAEDRVDFRQLVRDLGHELHERIDMRQIGVREEAAVVGGLARCGQELCCTRFGRQFEPVSIRMAKEQDLPLNSTKISGACGRLMCCLRYEFEAYRDFKGRAPKRNAVIDTPLGKAKIVEYDTPKEQLTLRLENGKQLRVALAEMEASDTAKKKAADLGCACRPDTVTREALEHLQSPDVQMALAELDRKMGIQADETTDTNSDVFVSTEPQQKQSGPENRSKRSQEKETASSSRRRRRKRHSGDAATTKVEASNRTQQVESTDQPGKSRRRRRKHVSSESPVAKQETSAASTSTTQQQAKRPRRRPGDRGGSAAAGEATGKTPAQQTTGENSTRKRRRRHRGGRGRGKNNNEASSSSKSSNGSVQ